MRCKTPAPGIHVLVLVILILFLGGTGAGLCGVSKTPQQHEIYLEKVQCSAFPKHSYALFVPKNPDTEKVQDLLIAFDPGGRAPLVIELLRDTARKWNLVLAVSYTIKNGPTADIVSGINVLWNDLASRFPLKNRLLFLTGFSGGARAATLFSTVTGQPAAAVIGCGAGLSQSISLKKLNTDIYLGLAGYGDFNFNEMVQLDELLDSTPVTHRFQYFDSDHSWPKSQVMEQALDRVHLLLMKIKKKETDSPWQRKFLKAQVTWISEMKRKGDFLGAFRELNSLIEDFSGIFPVDHLVKRKEALQKNRVFKKQARHLSALHGSEIGFHQRLSVQFKLIDTGNPLSLKLKEIASTLDIPFWKKMSETRTVSVQARGMARRSLNFLVQKGIYQAEEYLKQKMFPRAELLYRLIDITGVSGYVRQIALYNLCCLYTRKGRLKKGIHYLKKSVKAGFANLQLLETDPDLAPLRKKNEFSAVVTALKNRHRNLRN